MQETAFNTDSREYVPPIYLLQTTTEEDMD